MQVNADKGRRHQNSAAANEPSKSASSGETTFEFVDNRAEAVQLRKLQAIADNSPLTARTGKTKALAKAVATVGSGTADARPALRQPREAEFEDAPAATHGEAVQRTVAIAYSNQKKKEGIDNPDVVGFVKILNKAVEEARLYAISVPYLGALGRIDGHTAKWVDDTFPLIAAGKPPSSTHTDFGYVVETIATMRLPKSFKNMQVILQGVRPGTRPDVILYNKGDVAWLDITASKSETHIDGKVGWYDKANCSYAVEVTYDSLDQAAVNLMVKNKEAKASNVLDTEGLKAQIEEQRLLLGVRMAHWRELGKKISSGLKLKSQQLPQHELAYRAIPTTNALIVAFETGHSRLTPQGVNVMLENAKFQLKDFVRLLSSDHGDIYTLMKETPAILTALGLGPKSFGFSGDITSTLGMAASLSTGIAWLQANDKTMPTSAK